MMFVTTQLMLIGAMIMRAQLDIIESLVQDAIQKVAKLHCGGKRNSSLHGQFFEPTLSSNITADMRIKEEVFGPVIFIIMVPNDSDDEWIRLVNDCDFGLQ